MFLSNDNIQVSDFISIQRTYRSLCYIKVKNRKKNINAIVQGLLIWGSKGSMDGLQGGP